MNKSAVCPSLLLGRESRIRLECGTAMYDKCKELDSQDRALSKARRVDQRQTDYRSDRGIGCEP
jgi:hypothetical protein